MVEIKRSGHAVWTGGLRKGTGKLGTESGALATKPYSFSTRFEEEPGTNPEELIAAAHAGCYSMALADTLGRSGHSPQRIETQATAILTRQEEGGFRITRMELQAKVEVEGLDDETFNGLAEAAEKACPVSNALRGNVQIVLDAQLA